eukprot:s976_g8.t1
MWGHGLNCACPVCFSLNRVFPLLREGSRFPGFVHIAGGHVRVLEGELRDLLFSCTGQGRTEPPRGANEGVPPPPGDLQPPGPEQVDPPAAGEGTASASQQADSKASEDRAQQLFPKSKPPEPGSGSAPTSEEPAAPGVTAVPPESEEAEAALKVKEETPPRAAEEPKEKSEARARSSGTKARKNKRRTRSRSQTAIGGGDQGRGESSSLPGAVEVVRGRPGQSAHLSL